MHYVHFERTFFWAAFMYLCAANPEADDAEPGVAGAGPGVPALDADERASAITLARVATLQNITN